jgi:hypothetical protein
MGDRLLQDDFDVTYRPGRDNVVADCLTRAYDDGTTGTTSPTAAAPTVDVTSDQLDNELVQTIFGELATPIVTFDNVAAATEADSILSDVLNHVISGWPADKKTLTRDLRAYADVQHELSTSYDGRCVVRGCQTVIPASLRATMLELAHEGHSGIVRMKQRCREAIWWPGIDRDIEHRVHCLWQVSTAVCQPSATASVTGWALAENFGRHSR